MSENKLRYKKIAENKNKNTFEYRIKGGIFLNCAQKDWGVSRYVSLPLDVVKDLNQSIKLIASDLMIEENPQSANGKPYTTATLFVHVFENRAKDLAIKTYIASDIILEFGIYTKQDGIRTLSAAVLDLKVIEPQPKSRFDDADDDYFADEELAPKADGDGLPF